MKKFFIPFVMISFACAGSVYSYDESENEIEVNQECPFDVSVKIIGSNSDISAISTVVSRASCYDSAKDAEGKYDGVYKYSHSLGSSSTYSFKTLEEFEQICANIARFLSSLKNSEGDSLMITFGSKHNLANGKNLVNTQIKVETSLEHQKVAEILNKYFRCKDKIVDINTSGPNKFGFGRDDSEEEDFEKAVMGRRNKDRRICKHINNGLNVWDDFKKFAYDFNSLLKPFYEEDDSEMCLNEDRDVRHSRHYPKKFNKKNNFDKPFFRRQSKELRFFDVEPENATRIEKKTVIDRTKIDMTWVLNNSGNNENLNLHVKFLKGVLKTIFGYAVNCVYAPERKTLVLSFSAKENANAMEMKIYGVVSELARNGVDLETFNSIKYDLIPAGGFNGIFSEKAYAEDIPGISYEGFNSFLKQFRIAPTVVSIFLPNGRR